MSVQTEAVIAEPGSTEAAPPVAARLHLPAMPVIERTMAGLKGRNFSPHFVASKEAALREVLRLVPAGARVAHGGSTTLKEIGLIDYLGSGTSAYQYLNPRWLEETDPRERQRLRAALAVGADYFLGSVAAITEAGEAVAADAGGSRQGPYVFGPAYVIWVVGVQKIVPTLADALRRLREVALPLEDQRMKSTGAPGSRIGKTVIFEWDVPNRIDVVLVDEPLGF